jgi:hypothetical protein
MADMTTSTLPSNSLDSRFNSPQTPAVWLDWAEAASPAVLERPRMLPPEFVYRGSEDPHWNGQGYDVVDPDYAAPGLCTVRFSCGCVAHVTESCITSRSSVKSTLDATKLRS